MARLSLGRMAPTAPLLSIHNEPVSLVCAQDTFVHVQFRRFAGCPVCNYHLHQFAQAQDQLQELGVREVVFFHSSQEEMLKYQGQLPFDCVADPTLAHYKRWGVERDWRAIFHPKVAFAGFMGFLKTGRLYKRAENGIFGLPADFLLDNRGSIVSMNYGSHADDQWSLEQLSDIVLKMR
ncbi:peroxiredoxin-like family protein [Teredinibacter turnerae]|uniref:peroxiredoxin-like family protein n=1 Tax=Teredinibacter turnerae TaxID=2426 RepID=UPI000423E6E6|nr:peroxiredoxin-like family protein [Teredinibacter turnerae]